MMCPTSQENVGRFTILAPVLAAELARFFIWSLGALLTFCVGMFPIHCFVDLPIALKETRSQFYLTLCTRQRYSYRTVFDTLIHLNFIFIFVLLV